MIKIERLRFRYSWSMMTRSIHECWHVRTNKCVRTNICKKSVFVVSVRNINICGRILTQFTGLLRTNTVAAKRDLLAERTGLGKSVSVSLCKNRPQKAGWVLVDTFQLSGSRKICISLGNLEDENGKTKSWRNTYRGVDLKKMRFVPGDSLVPIHQLLVPDGKLWMGTKEILLVYQNIIFEFVVSSQPWCDLFFKTQSATHWFLQVGATHCFLQHLQFYQNQTD